MNQGNQQLVREYAMAKRVYAHCKTCDKSVGDFCEFKKCDSRRNWSGQLNKMDWDINFQIRDQKISCDCGNPLGKMVNENDVMFDRKSMNLKY